VPKTGGVATLFQLLNLFERQDLHTKYTRDYNDGKIRYSEMKDELADIIFKGLSPIRDKRKEFEGRPELVDKIIEESLVKCRARAEETMKEVREKIGLI